MRLRSYLALTTALVCSLVLTPALLSAEQSQVIKIVTSLPRTGSSNAQTTSIVNGVKMALSDVGGKVGEFELLLEDLDDASPERGNWDPAIEAQNADRAIKDPDVMVYIGPYNSGASKISMPKLNQAGLVMINPAATWPGLTKSGIGEPNEPRVYRPAQQVNFFRVVPADDIQGRVAAKWASEMGVKRVFVKHDGELYGKGIAGVFKKSAPANGLEIVGFEQIDPKASNYKSLAIKVKQLQPDLAYFGGLTQTNAGQLVKDLRAGGFSAKIMLPDGCFESAFIEAAGKEAIDSEIYITFGGMPPAKLAGKGQEFFQRYKQTYNSEPEAYAIYGYEAGKVAVDAIRRAGKKDRAAILAAVAATKDFEGALGKWSFDPNGDTSLVLCSGNTIKDGKFEFVKLLS